MSRLRRRHKEGAEVSTESLNDIMFFLMLFFLIVSTLVNPNVIRLALPNSKSNSSMAKQPIILSVDKDKVIFVNKQQVNIEDLKSKLSSLMGNMENPTVVLRLDQSLTVQDLVNIMQIGNELKIKMVLATAPAK
ncbi:MAG: ExbD/TolR family protein [Chitinophagales bacterium]|jgi:biopolymer transport protein ExbD|nr:biopolymer transporter ExbD [Sphingobacteriales bacterium]